MHRLRTARPSSNVASGSWYLHASHSISHQTHRLEYVAHVPIEQTERKVAAVAVRGKGHLYECAEIVYPVEVGRIRRDVVTAEEQVDGVGLARAQRLCERAADPRRGGRRAQGVGVADLVQADVAFDVFRELHGVTWCKDECGDM